MKYYYIILAILLGIVGSIVYYEEELSHWECKEEAVVLDILKVHYRSATILTDKGEIVLNQSTVKDGDKICLRGGRVWNEER